MKLLLTLPMLLLGISPFSIQSVDQSNHIQSQKVDRLMEDLLAKSKVAGISISVRKSGEMILKFTPTLKGELFQYQVLNDAFHMKQQPILYFTESN